MHRILVLDQEAELKKYHVQPVTAGGQWRGQRRRDGKRPPHKEAEVVNILLPASPGQSRAVRGEGGQSRGVRPGTGYMNRRQLGHAVRHI